LRPNPTISPPIFHSGTCPCEIVPGRPALPVRAAELAPQNRADLMARRRGRDDLRLAERVRRDPPRRDPRRDVRLADAVAGLHRRAAFAEALRDAVGDLALL
jgi:hypothetical protein